MHPYVALNAYFATTEPAVHSVDGGGTCACWREYLMYLAISSQSYARVVIEINGHRPLSPLISEGLLLVRYDLR